MAYYNRPSGAAYDDPNYYRMRTPGMITFISLVITIAVIVLLVIYTDIKWGWYLVLTPVLAGTVIGILNTPNRTMQAWLTWIVCIVTFALSFVVIGFLGGPMGGLVGAVIITLLFWSGISHAYQKIRNNYMYADNVEMEVKKRMIQDRFKGRKMY